MDREKARSVGRQLLGDRIAALAEKTGVAAAVLEAHRRWTARKLVA